MKNTNLKSWGPMSKAVSGAVVEEKKKIDPTTQAKDNNAIKKAKLSQSKV